MCFVTEMLGEDLYTILKQGKFRGLSLSLISVVCNIKKVIENMNYGVGKVIMIIMIIIIFFMLLN